MTTTDDSTPPEAVDLMAALKASIAAAADKSRESYREYELKIQNIADTEWDRAQRTGVTSLKECPGCEHRIFEHDRTEGEAVRCCRDCDCDRYARVF